MTNHHKLSGLRPRRVIISGSPRVTCLGTTRPQPTPGAGRAAPLWRLWRWILLQPLDGGRSHSCVVLGPGSLFPCWLRTGLVPASGTFCVPWLLRGSPPSQQQRLSPAPAQISPSALCLLMHSPINQRYLWCRHHVTGCPRERKEPELPGVLLRACSLAGACPGPGGARRPCAQRGLRGRRGGLQVLRCLPEGHLHGVLQTGESSSDSGTGRAGDWAILGPRECAPSAASEH